MAPFIIPVNFPSQARMAHRPALQSISPKAPARNPSNCPVPESGPVPPEAPFPLRAGQLPVTVDVPHVVTIRPIARRWFVSHAARRCPVSQVAFVSPLLLVDPLDCVYCFCISSPFYGPHVFASSSALSSKLLFFLVCCSPYVILRFFCFDIARTIGGCPFEVVRRLPQNG